MPATPVLFDRRTKHVRMDAHRIAPRLWQGAYLSAEARGATRLCRDGFTMLVCCAMEHQPPAAQFPGLQLVHVPLDDNGRVPVSDATWHQVTQAAWRIAAHHRSGGRPLITCHMGLNRSGIVTARTLNLLQPKTPISTVIDCIRGRRPEALFNERFVEALIRRC